MHAEAGYVEHLATNRYFDRTFGCDAVKVLPGEYFVTTSDIVLVTVLGSCVTACVRDRDKGLGGMNHFMLPDNGGELDVLSSSARYGAYAMEVLLNHLLKMGARRSSLEAKVFGGGRVMMKKLVRVKNDTLIAREREYEARLRRDNVQGDVELFG